MKTISKAGILLTAILIISFTTHYLIGVQYQSDALGVLALTYGFNFTITMALLLVFRIFITRNVKQIGSVFLFSSMVKFLLFFAVIAPVLKTTGTVKSFAFAAFFIPYAICLISEVLATIRLLKEYEQ